MMSVDSVWLEDDVGRIYIGRPQEEDGNLDRGDQVGGISVLELTLRDVSRQSRRPFWDETVKVWCVLQ